MYTTENSQNLFHRFTLFNAQNNDFIQVYEYYGRPMHSTDHFQLRTPRRILLIFNRNLNASSYINKVFHVFCFLLFCIWQN